ncbi:Uncharacterised protein [Serratia fonticola]|nr:Uncharacterised protein [Serratia fonticola]
MKLWGWYEIQTQQQSCGTFCPLSLWECTDRGHHEHLFGDMVDTYNIGMSTSEWSCLCRGMRDLPCHYVPSLCFSPRKKALISVRYAVSSA